MTKSLLILALIVLTAVIGIIYVADSEKIKNTNDKYQSYSLLHNNMSRDYLIKSTREILLCQHYMVIDSMNTYKYHWKRYLNYDSLSTLHYDSSRYYLKLIDNQ